MKAKKTILVVDDTKFDREYLDSSLSDAGYNVLTAYDGVNAQEVIDRHGHPDLVLTDLQMPRVDGFELVEALRKTDYKGPIVVNSSLKFSDLSKQQRERLKDSTYIEKLAGAKKIVRRISELLGEAEPMM